MSWTGGGTNTSRLSNWLDPSNSGAMTTNTTNVSNLNNFPAQGSFLPISGNDVVCGTSASYTISGVSPNASVTWALYGPDANGYALPLQGVCSLTANGPQATLTKITDGTVKILATVTNCGGIIQYATKTITFGVPELYSYAGFYDNNIYQPLSGTATYIASSTTYLTLESSYNNLYTWELNSKTNNAAWYTSNQNTYGFIWFNKPIYTYDYIGFSIHTSNICGTRTDPVFLIYNGPTQYYKIAPNPAQSTITILELENSRKRLDPITRKTLAIDFQKLEIFDKMGKCVFVKRYDAGVNAATENISDLRADVYTVKLYIHGGIETHKLVVQR